MSEPEIARRCPTCSAMIRVRAPFCPHCGAPLARHTARATTETAPESVDETDRRASTITPRASTDSFATGRPVDNYKSTDNQDRRRPIERKQDSPAIKPRRIIATKAAAAREQIGDNLRPRVEKLRQTSSIVLDEAADDPGLRFVLIAAALFLLAVVLLVFGKLLG